jgi:hypothetical protein
MPNDSPFEKHQYLNAPILPSRPAYSRSISSPEEAGFMKRAGQIGSRATDWPSRFALRGSGRYLAPRRLGMAKAEEAWVQLATRIPKSLHRELKLHCVHADTSVMEFVVAALKEKLAKVAGRKRGREE